MKKTLIFLSAASLAVFMFVGCEGASHSEDDGHGHQDKEAAHESEEISFTAKQAEAVGLKLETVAPGDFSEVIKVSGQILSNQGDEMTIVATSDGVISFLNPSLSEGVAVGSGEALFSISSKNIVNGDPITKAKIEYETAQKEYERASGLVNDNIVSAKEFEQVRLRYETAKANYQGIGVNADGNGVKVSSPLRGYLKSRLVKQGDYVSVGQPLATVSQNKRLQLRAEVSERYFDQLKGVSTANFVLPYTDHLFKLSELNGRLLSFGKSTAENSFYIPVIFEFDNIGNIIAGSFAEIYLITAVRKNVVSVPVSALTEEQGVYFVYVQLDDEGYKKQEVQIGQNNGDRVEIKSGLIANDKVVIKGAIQVKLAASSSVVPEGHSHSH